MLQELTAIAVYFIVLSMLSLLMVAVGVNIVLIQGAFILAK